MNADVAVFGSFASWGNICVALLAMGALAKAVVEFSTNAVKRDIKDVERIGVELKHDLKNQSMKTSALEIERTKDVERLVKLEIRQEVIERNLTEIKLAMVSNHRDQMDAQKAWADQLSESIREIRKVAPKG